MRARTVRKIAMETLGRREWWTRRRDRRRAGGGDRHTTDGWKRRRRNADGGDRSGKTDRRAGDLTHYDGCCVFASLVRGRATGERRRPKRSRGRRRRGNSESIRQCVLVERRTGGGRRGVGRATRTTRRQLTAAAATLDNIIYFLFDNERKNFEKIKKKTPPYTPIRRKCI